MPPVVLNLDILCDRHTQRIRWSGQPVSTALTVLWTAVGARSTEGLVQVSFFLRRPCRRCRILSCYREEVFVIRNESTLYNLEASTTQNRKKYFQLFAWPSIQLRCYFTHFFKVLFGGNLQCRALLKAIRYDSRELLGLYQNARLTTVRHAARTASRRRVRLPVSSE